MKTEKQIKQRIIDLEHEFFNEIPQNAEDKLRLSGRKTTLKALKNRVQELYWVLGKLK